MASIQSSTILPTPKSLYISFDFTFYLFFFYPFLAVCFLNLHIFVGFFTSLLQLISNLKAKFLLQYTWNILKDRLYVGSQN